MENSFEDRVIDTFSRMLEILEKYSDYGCDKKFVEEKRNSESELARKDLVQEVIESVDSYEREKVKGEIEAKENMNEEPMIKSEIHVEAGIMEEQKSSTNKIKLDEQKKMNSINGSLVVKITAYTWEKFFEKRFANEVRHENRPQFFTMSKAKEISEKSQSYWILIRVHKAQSGRSPMLNWRDELIGLSYGEQKAHIFIYLLQNPSQHLHMWLQNTAELFSVYSPFATLEAKARQITQDEDAKAVEDYYSSDESYEAWYGILIFNFSDCLVFNTSEFENSGTSSAYYNSWRQLFFYLCKVRTIEMGKSFHGVKREEINLAFLSSVNIVRLTVNSNSTDTERVNWKVLLGDHYIFTQLWSLVAQVLKCHAYLDAFMKWDLFQ